MNEEKYTQLLEDGELFSYINDLQQRIDKAIDILIVVYGGNDEYYIKTIEKARNILKGTE